MEKEALTLEALAIAMAAHNSGGIVIVQVEQAVANGTLNARQVKIPGILVDCVVVAEKPEYHMQTFATPTARPTPARERVPLSSIAPMPLCERKIIARRALMELSRRRRRQPRHRHAGRRGAGGRRRRACWRRSR